MRTLKTAGLRHVALTVQHLEDCCAFYTQLLGMQIEWQPDADNIYLSSGSDNLALHRAKADFVPSRGQRLDHIGFILNTPEEVDQWHEFLVNKAVKILAKPKTHRDGARSFYCSDPEGVVVQMIFHPPISALR